MPFLSPAKILVILVIALIVLGPDKLPRAAKQLGSLWSDLRKMRARLESEVRGTFPDLPSTTTITQAVRSPFSFLDSLADSHAAEQRVSGNGATPGGDEQGAATGEGVQPPPDPNRPAGTVEADEPPLHIPGVSVSDPGGVVHRVRAAGVVVPDDPGMN